MITPGHWNRWVTLAAGVELMFVAGAVYGFGSIAADIKEVLGASESEKELIGVFGNAGLWTGSALGGLVSDRIGPFRVGIGAALLLALSYQLMYHSLLHPQEPWATPLCCAFWWFGVGQACGWLYNSVMFCNARNFGDETRAFVLGTLALAFGMSSTVWATFLHSCVGGKVEEDPNGGFICTGGFINGDVRTYMAFMSVVSPAIVTMGAFFSNRLTVDEVEGAEAGSIRVRFGYLCGSSLLGLLFVLVSSVLQAVGAEDRAMVGWQTWAAIALSVLLCLPVLVVAKSGQLWMPRDVPSATQAPLRQQMLPDMPVDPRNSDFKHQDFVVEESQDSEGRLIPAQAPRREELQPDLECPVNTDKRPAAGTDNTVQDAICRVEFWLLVGIMIGCTGTNVTMINLMTTLVKDRSGSTWCLANSDQIGNVAVIVVMGTSSISRCGAGLVMYAKPAVAKSSFVYAAVLFTVLSQVLLSIDNAVLIFPGCLLLGLSDGCVWTSVPWLTGKVFGLKNMGSIFGVIVCIGATGVIMLSYGLEPAVYNGHASGNECYGIGCFRITHLTCAALNVLLLPVVYLFRCLNQRQFDSLV